MKKYLKILIFSVLVSYLMIFFLRPVEMEDIWWHIKTGEWMMQNHQVPYIDTFSPVTPPSAWITNQWLGSCFYYQTGACSGACQHIEKPESYNERATEAIEYLQRSFTDNFFLVTDGKSKEEKAIILIEEGHYRGYGYLNVDDLNQGVEEWKEAIKYMSPNPECNQIVMTWMISILCLRL